ncbi:hypothetical protein EYF80_028042 [Liparis tanakae]|uniref:Uncharacterized protein n=1 Tax=Liparis tanakae TaxID=230148 RepID=A0A4Z2H9N8_9TELE|nr:hypothetical protein EYF80_028042 [Liparis tanakae]
MVQQVEEEMREEGEAGVVQQVEEEEAEKVESEEERETVFREVLLTEIEVDMEDEESLKVPRLKRKCGENPQAKKVTASRKRDESGAFTDQAFYRLKKILCELRKVLLVEDADKRARVEIN